LFTFDQPRETDYPTDPGVDRTDLHLMRESQSFWQALINNSRRIHRLRNAIRDAQPDVVLSLSTTVNVTALLACRRLCTPVIVSEHIDPWRQQLPSAWRFLRKRTYPRAAAITVETGAVEHFFQQMAPRVPIHVVANPVKSPVQRTLDVPKHPGARRQIVALGRLVPQKGFDLLIESFRRLADQHPNWDVRIIGDGPSREQLQQQIADCKLKDRVELYGWSTNPGPLLAQGDLFVFSSRYEGFGIALMDAMACGLPVISFNCPHGPAEIVRHNVDGLLVAPEDIGALVDAMDRLMSSPQERKRLASRAPEVLTRFSEERYFEKWRTILMSVLERD